MLEGGFGPETGRSPTSALEHPPPDLPMPAPADLLDRIESILLECERQTRPPEVDPHRARLFDLFAEAYGEGWTAERGDDDAGDPRTDFSADALCRRLAARWGLADAARATGTDAPALSAAHVAKMRLLWSLLRMWIDWDYAWRRRPEFP